MKGRISRYGDLEIKRKNRWKPQTCPKDRHIVFCGDWCPKFYEPYDSTILNGEYTRKGTALRLCENDQLFFTEFTDYRK